MAEGTKHEPASSPITKTRGGDERRSIESPRFSTSCGKGVPHHLRSSSGSRHEFCKHGKPDDYVSEAMESRPWRKPVVRIGRDSKENGVNAVDKKTAVVKPNPSSDRKIRSPSRETLETEILDTAEHVDEHTEQASAAPGKSEILEGPDTSLPMAESAKQENVVGSKSVKVTAEEVPLDTKDLKLCEKSRTLSKAKPLLRLASAISLGSRAGRIIEGQKCVEGRKSVDGKKVLERGKSIDGRKGAEGRKSSDASKGVDESKRLSPGITQKCDGNASNVENNNEGNKSVNEMKRIEESKSLPENKVYEETKSSNMATNKKDGDLGNTMDTGKAVLLKKQLKGLRPKVLTVRPSPSLNPSTVKPPSAIQPSRGTLRKTSDGNQVTIKFSTSKMDAKKVLIPTTVSSSSKSLVSEEESANIKKVRVVRVISSVRRPSKITKVAAKNSNDQDMQQDTMGVIKTAPKKKPLVSTKIKGASSDSVLPRVPSVSKTTVTPMIPSLRLKKLVGESAQKIATKDAAASGLRKGKAVDPEYEIKVQNKLKVTSSKLHGENVQTNKRSYLKKRDISGGNVPENNLDSFHLRRPVMQRKKNVSVSSNKAIAETANRLIRSKRSKVLALIGAFETIISIQKKSSVRIKPRAKKISSSTKAPH